MPVAMVIRVNEWLPWDSAKGDILVLCVGARARGDFWTVVVISHIKMNENENGQRHLLKTKTTSHHKFAFIFPPVTAVTASFDMSVLRNVTDTSVS